MATTETQIRRIIRKIVREVMSESHDCNSVHPEISHEDWEHEQDSIEELNATSNVDGYQTPFAFSDKSEDDHEEDIKDTAEVFDFKKTENQALNTVKLEEGKSLYHLYRDHADYSPAQKIGVTVREVNRLLTEIEKLLRVSSRFKTETNLGTGAFWKTTNRYLSNIDEKIFRILSKVKDIKEKSYEE
tara:strand:+ start:34051 stop:34611 length:561 start_codon:yes stop_codon:yes gene_type:complete